MLIRLSGRSVYRDVGDPTYRTIVTVTLAAAEFHSCWNRAEMGALRSARSNLYAPDEFDTSMGHGLGCDDNVLDRLCR
jgi:hypothetical protein